MGLAIDVDRVGKQYRIGRTQEPYRTVRDALASAVLAPIRRIRNFGHASSRAEDIIWALKDVSFRVSEGEVLGVIGANGAGKSTLLKILTRITEPTTGTARLRGRVGSLLEVGTGFHAELTGRENVYLSGVILGMTRKEIDRRFDNIVDFSGVETFIDTPVKRYSSGMTVRLGFAVAAHLEPEILLVDEVLAVGDAAFQQKSLGKMENAALSGRTVLFVSHNMGAVANLCPRSIWLDKGEIRADGETRSVQAQYLGAVSTETRSLTSGSIQPARRLGTGGMRFTKVTLESETGELLAQIPNGKTLRIRLEFERTEDIGSGSIAVWVWFRDGFGRGVLTLGTRLVGAVLRDFPERGEVVCEIPRFPLRSGKYFLDLGLDIQRTKLDRALNAFSVDVVDGDFFGTGEIYHPSYGDVMWDHDWRLETPSADDR